MTMSYDFMFKCPYCGAEHDIYAFALATGNPEAVMECKNCNTTFILKLRDMYQVDDEQISS